MTTEARGKMPANDKDTAAGKTADRLLQNISFDKIVDEATERASNNSVLKVASEIIVGSVFRKHYRRHLIMIAVAACVATSCIWLPVTILINNATSRTDQQRAQALCAANKNIANTLIITIQNMDQQSREFAAKHITFGLPPALFTKLVITSAARDAAEIARLKPFAIATCRIANG